MSFLDDLIESAVDWFRGGGQKAGKRVGRSRVPKAAQGYDEQRSAVSPRGDGWSDALTRPQPVTPEPEPAGLSTVQLVTILAGGTPVYAPPGAAVQASALGDRMREIVRTSSGGTRFTDQTDFFCDIVADAVVAQLITGVSAAVTMGQAAQETAYGRSASRGNNFFGIKGEGSAGSTVESTWEEVGGQRVETTARFRAYDNRFESFVDHGRLISDNDIYSGAMKHNDDPDRMIQEIHAAGYATDSQYASNIQWIMSQWNLHAIDALVPQVKALWADAPAPTIPQGVQ